MRPSRRRSAVSSGLVQSGGGWGSGNITVPVTGSINISLNNSSFSGRQGNTSSRTLTLTRNDGFSGAVSLSVSDLPTGTTASFSASTLTGASLTSTLTLTHSANATLVTNAPIVVTASGSGVSDAVVNATVTVDVASSLTPFFTDSFSGGQLNPANGVTYFGLGSTTTPTTFDGAGAVRFRYGPNASGVGGGNAELRVNTNQQLADFGLQYDLHCPANFAHRNTEASRNNKFFMVWRTIYSDITNGTFQAGFEFNDTTVLANDSALVRVMARRSNLNSVTSSNPSGDYNPTGAGALLFSPSGPIIPGQWNQIRIHVRVASSSTAADGIQRLWVNGTKIVEITNGKFWNFDTGTTPADCYLQTFYLMGSANAGYTEQTDFHIRNLAVYAGNPGWE